MKLRITEQQLDNLLKYISEARKQPNPEKLSVFFDDNKGAKYFSVISRLKNASEDEYDFKIDNMSGHIVITDINKNTKTKNCSVDARFDTMLYGNTFSVNFGKCGVLTINNVIGLKIFNSIENLKNKKADDSYEVEHEFDKTIDDYVNQYYNDLKNAEIGDEIHIDSKFKYDGVVLQKLNNILRIELVKAGVKNSFIITIDIDNNPFTDDNNSLIFSSKAVKGDGEEFDFIIPIKKFFIDFKNEKKQEEPKNDEEPEDTNDLDGEPLGVDVPEEPNVIPLTPQEDAKKIMDAILNDPLMKQAFFKEPTLWNLIVSAFKGVDREGTGIVPAKKIISKYHEKNIEKQLGDYFNNFNFDKTINYTLLSKTITFKNDNVEGEPITYKTSNKYVANVMEINVDTENLTLFDPKTKVKIVINSKNTKERIPNSFNVTFKKPYINQQTNKREIESFDALITIESKRGSGYYDYKKQIKQTK